MANGDRYVGDFKDDMKHGSGIWYDNTKQTKQQAKYVNDKRTQWIGKP